MSKFISFILCCLISLSAIAQNELRIPIHLGRKSNSGGITLTESREEKIRNIISNLVSNMVYIESGTFMMGSDDARDNNPVCRQCVDSFHLGKYEVTQREWNALMDTNPSEFKGDDRPVENVSWFDCLEFIKKLNDYTGLSFRLPTEVEWEYAARGGDYSRGYRYSGSNDIGTVAWYDGNSYATTHDVGTKKPNELGLYDMSGNVGEWVSEKRPPGITESSEFDGIIRGGSFESIAACSSVRRIKYPRAQSHRLYGFRLAH